MDRVPDSKCDFCSKPNPEWSLPAQSFYHKTQVEPVSQIIHAFMREEWAACNACLALINAGKPRALAERVFLSDDVSYTISAVLYYDEVMREVMQFQSAFHRSRLQGPPVLIK